MIQVKIYEDETMIHDIIIKAWVSLQLCLQHLPYQQLLIPWECAQEDRLLIASVTSSKRGFSILNARSQVVTFMNKYVLLFPICLDLANNSSTIYNLKSTLRAGTLSRLFQNPKQLSSAVLSSEVAESYGIYLAIQWIHWTQWVAFT